MTYRKPERQPYRGTELTLAIAIDFGITFSGTSWALLEPEQIPNIIDVSGYEGQEFQASSTKVPTVIYYDAQGVVKAVGGEIYDPELTTKAEEERWTRVEWFKTLLKPRNQDGSLASAPIMPLPQGKALKDVVGDFLRYMSRSALVHFQQKVVGGNSLIEQLKNKVIYVLSYENGWDTFQRDFMRQAAVSGGLVPDTDEGRSRIHFVSEAEASLRWCLAHGVLKRTLVVGERVAVIDAGAGTITTSSYDVIGLSPLSFRESRASNTRLAGSVFVTEAFKTFVREKLELASSIYGDPETIARLVKEFDKTTKCVFRRKDRRSAVTFGSPRDNEPEFDIESGQLIVQGSDMADFFEPSCAAAVESVKLHLSPNSRTTIFLVGGFAASPWLYSEINRRLKDFNVDVFRADTMTAKSVANGALCYYLDCRIAITVAPTTYGVYVDPVYSNGNPDHVKRKDFVYKNPMVGQRYVSGGFQSYIKQGSIVQESQTTRIPSEKYVTTKAKTEAQLELICYLGQKLDISWVDEDPLHFQHAYTIKAEFPVEALVPVDTNARKNAIWKVTYDAVFSFGTTELECYVEWKDRKGGAHRYVPENLNDYVFILLFDLTEESV
ncbi:hypothetical protein FRC03_011053 [Tulasnella sp. 419]|nr:hypothetical protein FRC03_011053 [Tulasnella sp. 419]